MRYTAFHRLFLRCFRRILICGKPDVIGHLPTAYQTLTVRGRGQVNFGRGVSFGWKHSPGFTTSDAYLEPRTGESIIEIGDHCVFSNDACLISESIHGRGGIRIGARLTCGSRFRCYDSDFHGLSITGRNDPEQTKSLPVKIGDDCFIGENVMILKGVTLGRGCVVGAGSVVTSSFPDGAIIAGNPARQKGVVA